MANLRGIFAYLGVELFFFNQQTPSRWQSTKARISGPKYCKDTTYVGEYWLITVIQYKGEMISQVITGCLFHSQRFLSQDEIEKKLSIPAWQVKNSGASNYFVISWTLTNKFWWQDCQKICYTTGGCIAFMYKLNRFETGKTSLYEM